MQLEHVDDKTNRIKNLISLGEPQPYFHLDFRITSKCNYNCYYCTDLHCNSNSIVLFNLDKLADLILTLIEKGKILHVFIYGGEPTLHPQLFDIVDLFGELMQGKGILEIQSNYSNSKNYLETLSRIGCSYPVFKLSGSYHAHVSFKDFLEKTFIARKYNCLGMITFMYNSKIPVLDKFSIARKILGKQHTEISPLISSSVTEDPTESETNPFYEIEHLYKNEDISVLEDFSYIFRKEVLYSTTDGSFKTSQGEIWLNRCNSFSNMICNVALERLIIDWDGNTYRCFNNMFSSLGGRTFPLFNLNSLTRKRLEEYVTKDMHPITCAYRKCFFELEHLKITI
jgi:sulfatase maturation enzyme AslB (radical SAM superfamily)